MPVRSGRYYPPRRPADTDRPALPPLVVEIVAEMERQGLTRNALAVKAGLPAATVTRLFAGERPDPQLSTLVKLAAALGRRVTLGKTT